MKIELVATALAELELLLNAVKGFDAFAEYKKDFDSSQRKIRGALERISIKKMEDGWHGLKRYFKKSLEIELTGDEVLYLTVLARFVVRNHHFQDYHSLPQTLSVFERKLDIAA